MKQQQQQQHNANTEVSPESNGRALGACRLTGEDDGTIRHDRDHESLAVDAVLLLGKVKGQHAMQAELRFVPLDVPNLKLCD